MAKTVMFLLAAGVLSLQVNAYACLNSQQVQDQYSVIGEKLQEIYTANSTQLQTCKVAAEAAKTTALASLPKSDESSSQYEAVILKYNSDQQACVDNYNADGAEARTEAQAQYNATYADACNQ